MLLATWLLDTAAARCPAARVMLRPPDVAAPDARSKFHGSPCPRLRRRCRPAPRPDSPRSNTTKPRVPPSPAQQQGACQSFFKGLAGEANDVQSAKRWSCGPRSRARGGAGSCTPSVGAGAAARRPHAFLVRKAKAPHTDPGISTSLTAEIKIIDRLMMTMTATLRGPTFSSKKPTCRRQAGGEGARMSRAGGWSEKGRGGKARRR